jgi:hypothetical protein
VAHAEAAVDRQHGAADVRGSVGGEELVFSGRAAVMSVSTKPGATTLAVMPRPPSSRVIERAIPTSAALEDE